MLRTWYFRWVVAGIILWVGALAIGLALLTSGPGPGGGGRTKARAAALLPTKTEHVSSGERGRQSRDELLME